MRVMQAAQRFDDDVAHNMTTIARLRPRIVAMTEMAIGPNDDVRLSAARKILGPAGYTVCVGEDGGDHCHEIPVAFREGRVYKIDRVQVIQLSPDLPGDGLGNDRHLTVIRFHNRLTGRKKAHAHTHWNAGIQGPHGNMLKDPRVTAAAAGSRIMEGVLRALLGEGRDLSVTGDFNWRLHDNDADFHVWEHSPKAMFGRLGLDYVTTGLDWLAWSKRSLRRVGRLVVLDPGHDGNGADHPWIVARLRRKVAGR